MSTQSHSDCEVAADLSCHQTQVCSSSSSASLYELEEIIRKTTKTTTKELSFLHLSKL